MKTRSPTTSHRRTPNEEGGESDFCDGRDGLVLLGCLALAHLIFYPALRPGVFLYGRDTTAHDFGLLLYNWSLIADQGQLGLWNPYLFCGLPALGTFASCPFYPITWLFALLPVALAFTCQYILNDALAGVWTYWAARWIGLRRPAALFAGMVFMVSGHVVTLAHAGHLQKLASIAWMPFVFGCATAAMKRKRWGYWIGCGVGLAAQLLASHVQIAYSTLLFLIPWIVWQAIGAGRSGGSAPTQVDNLRHSAWFAGFGLAIALLVAAGLSAAQILPALETTPLTNRGAGLTFEAVADTSYPPLEFAEYLLPGFLGDSTSGSRGYWGRWGTERIVSDYMGLLPVILAVFGLVVGWRDRDRWFWLAVLLIAAILAAGGYTPVFRAAFRWLPGLNRFRSPATILVFIAWPTAILAGRGFEDFVDRVTRDAASRSRYLVISVAATVLLVLLRWGLLAPGIEWPWIGAPSRSVLARSPADLAILTSVQRSLLFGALSCAVLAAVAAGGYLYARGRRAIWALAVGALFTLAFVDPRLHEARYIKAADLRPFHLYLLHHWSDSILQTLPQPVRGIEIGNEYSNRMMTRGIASLHGYHPVHLQQYVDLMDLYAQDRAALGRLVFQQFVLTPEGRSLGNPSPAALTREYERGAAENGQVLWLRRPPLLYAYFPQEIAAAPDRATLLAAMARPDFDPDRRSYTLDPALGYAGQVVNLPGSSVGQVVNLSNSMNQNTTATARVIRYSPDRIDLEVSCDRDRPMIVAELAAPGWQWILDGNGPFPPATANHAFRAARVPAGNHAISMVYRPFSFRLGLYLTLASLLSLAALLPVAATHRED